MKKNYFSLVLLFCASMSFAQIDFNNGGGDGLWSNTANWVGGILPTSTDVVQLITTVESLVDTDFTITGIRSAFGLTADVPVAGTGTLTINAGVNAAFAIENVSDGDMNLVFKGNVTINNSAAAPALTLMRNNNGNTNDVNGIVFDNGSLLTLLTNLEGRVGSGGDIFYFNGALAGTAALRLAANTTCVFGNTSSNSGFNGDFVFVGANSLLVVNTADNETFLPAGRKIQSNNTSSIEVNGANVMQGDFSVAAANTLTINANKNQNDMKNIVFAVSGTINLNIGASVTELAFANNSASAWNSGTLNITNFTEGVVRFGTDNTGLTVDQLSKIVVDGTGGPVALDANGYLVYESSLSVSEFEENAINFIAYPTLTSDRLYFNKPQKNVKIFNLIGKLLKHNTSKNQSEIGVDFLSAGLYLIVFDNQKVEKFLKK